MIEEKRLRLFTIGEEDFDEKSAIDDLAACPKGSLLADANFHLTHDVTILHDAMLSHNCDIILQVLCHRSKAQRIEMGRAYEMTYGVTIPFDIKTLVSLSSRFSILMTGLTMPFYQYMARAVHNGYAYLWMCYIMIILPNHVRLSMRNYFKIKYECDMMDMIENKIYFDHDHPDDRIFKQIKRVTETDRDESSTIREKEVVQDVKYLRNIKKSRKVVKTMLYTKSFKHIAAVSVEYETQTGKTLESLIEKTYTDNQLVLLNIVNYAKNPVNYFARALRRSMCEMMLIKHILNSIVLLRCELDMCNIKAEFERLYGESLKSVVRTCTTGHYKYALYELLGEKSPYQQR